MVKVAAIFLFTILAAVCLCDTYKILMISPLPAKSHGILGMGFVKHLLNAGHEVTYITSYPTNNTNPRLHEIDVSTNSRHLKDMFDIMNIEAALEGKVEEEEQALFFLMFGEFAKVTVEDENVQKLLQNPNQHFDVVIAEWLLCELYSGIAAIYNAPLIWFSTIEPHWMILNLVDDYTNPSYDAYIVESSSPFTFQERLTELWNMIKMATVRETIALFRQTRTYNNAIAPIIESRGRAAPSFSELRFNASLVLGNSHVSMGQATRLPQSYKPIGGYHIDEKVKPLPEDLKNLLENAKEGVIYFSMGSNLKSTSMPKELKKSLIEMFGTLKQTVLWKFEEKFPNLPKNVHIIEWAPQQSILAHPNCLLFITHGGLLSTTETIFTGKPIIGIPVFADQFANVARAVSKGFARRVDLSYTMAGELKTAIVDILSDPRYTQKAKELSLIYHDRPASPSQELVHWVEHVIKTGGAPHLRSPALMVPWYQKIYLDLVFLIIVAIIVIKIILKRLLSVLLPKHINNSKKKN